jgi:ribosomal protein L24E
MTPDALFLLLAQARAEGGHAEFVVIGSLSVLGLHGLADIPPDMTLSIDVDAYTKADPPRIFDLLPALGENSAFHHAQGIFLDAVSPKLPTLPAGWEGRLIPVERDGVTAWFLDPHDAAISKLARSEPRDLRWVRAGVRAGLMTLPVLRARMRQTSFLDEEEQRGAAASLETIAAKA